MKYLFILLLSPLFIQCHNAQQTDEEELPTQALTPLKKPSQEIATKMVLDPAEPAMQRAWYEYDKEAKAPINAYRAGFVTLADTSLKPTGFIAVEERLLRQQSTISDTTISPYRVAGVSQWKELTPRQRRAKIAREQAFYARLADSLHASNNQGSYRVWLMNNSADTIALATQDASLVCILQAQDIRKQWQPVQFWRFSGCGNSNIARYLLPNEHISFLAKVPRHGNFKTTLRYKLAGAKQFYYSNEFMGRINYDEFKERPHLYTDNKGVKRQSGRKSFKLDSLLRADYRGNVASSFLRGGETIKLFSH
jgi:hypothetical protein